MIKGRRRGIDGKSIIVMKRMRRNMMNMYGHLFGMPQLQQKLLQIHWQSWILKTVTFIKKI